MAPTTFEEEIASLDVAGMSLLGWHAWPDSYSPTSRGVFGLTNGMQLTLLLDESGALYMTSFYIAMHDTQVQIALVKDIIIISIQLDADAWFTAEVLPVHKFSQQFRDRFAQVSELGLAQISLDPGL